MGGPTRAFLCTGSGAPGASCLAGTPPYFAPRDGELASSSNRPFFGERLKGFELQSCGAPGTKSSLADLAGLLLHTPTSDIPSSLDVELCSELEQRLSLSSAMEFSASEPLSDMSETDRTSSSSSNSPCRSSGMLDSECEEAIGSDVRDLG